MSATPPAPALRTRHRTAAAAAMAMLLTACGSAPPLPVLPTELPAVWRSAGPASAAAAPAPDLQGWWTVFADPVLDALVEQALAGNLTLAQARSRWQESRRLAAADGRRFRPVLDAGVRTVQDAAAIDNYLQSSIEVSWELALFGRQPAVDQGLRARADTSTATAQAARVSVIAELVRQYIALRTAQAETARLRRLRELDDHILALLEVSGRSRLGSPEHHQAALLRRAQTEAAAAAPRASVSAAAQTIAVLLGQPTPDARWLEPVAQLPAAPLVVHLAQVPADLLRFRPDVRLAEADVEQASSELGLARAELYPRVTLGLAYVFAYNLTQNRRNVNSNLPAFGLEIDVPLLDWGRRRAVAGAREDALRAAVLGYRQALISAYGETETALAGYVAARDRADRLDDAEQVVGRQRALQATRERLGLASTLDRLEGERAALLLSGDRAEAAAACSQAYIQVYEALGGAPWADIGEQPVDRPTAGATS